MKRFWDTNYPGHPYDPVARRRGQSTETPATLAPIASTRTANVPGVAGTRSGGKTPVSGHRSGSATAVHHEQVLGLQAQLKEMSAHLEGLEKERDFYFAKVFRLLFFLTRPECFFFVFLCSPVFVAATRYRDLGAATDGRARKRRPRGHNAFRNPENSLFYRGTPAIRFFFFRHLIHLRCTAL